MFDIEDFIRAVKERSALYNRAHPLYNRKDVRAQLWAEIGSIMYPNWERLSTQDKTEKGAFLQKKWKSLKDCFHREIRQQKIENPRRPRKKYEYYDQLSFLYPKNTVDVIRLRMSTNEVRIKSETVDKAEDETPSQSGSALKSTEIHIPEVNQRKRKSSRTEQEKPLKQIKKPEVAEDCDRLFLMSFLEDLKKLPVASKYWVKMKFSEIMHQAAMSLAPELESVSVEYEAGSPDYEDDLNEEENSPDSSLSEVFVCKIEEETEVKKN